MTIKIREFHQNDIEYAISIWNDVVADGIAFPQLDLLDKSTGIELFNSQTFTAIAFNQDNGEIVGLYILHPNNVGRCAHICNASYAVKKSIRGQKVGEKLVVHCLMTAKKYGFKILQFNAVVASNTVALNLYKKLNFTVLGVIPCGFQLKDGTFQDIIPHYIEL